MRRTRKKRTGTKKDPAKEAIYRQLVTRFQEAGVEVRREKLKRGLGWRVQSGACQVELSDSTKRIVFVDQRLGQDDQLRFLRDRALSMGIDLDAERDVAANS